MQLKIDCSALLRGPGDEQYLAKVVGRIIDGWHAWASPDPHEAAELREYFRRHPTHLEVVEKSHHALNTYGDGRYMKELSISGSGQGGDAGGATILGLREASLSLDRELTVLVENELNDGAFCLQLFDATDPTLSEAFAGPIPAVRFSHGGGSGVAALAEARGAKAAEQGLLLRYVILVDSDATYPGERSPAVRELEKIADRYDIPLIVLSKRAIENYVPDEVLAAYGESCPDIRPAADFLQSLTGAARDHYPVKKGLKVAQGCVTGAHFEAAALYDLQVPDGSTPSLARVIDYFLGGTAPRFTAQNLASRDALHEAQDIASRIKGEL